jgi:hypothetical protein
MKPFHVAWVLITAVAPVTAVLSDVVKELRYWFYIDNPEQKEWQPAKGPASLEKLEMERNGTLRGPKVFIPNPGFEINMGKPWKVVGRGVEVVDDASLSRRGRNSL